MHPESIGPRARADPNPPNPQPTEPAGPAAGSSPSKDRRDPYVSPCSLHEHFKRNDALSDLVAHATTVERRFPGILVQARDPRPDQERPRSLPLMP